MKIFTQGNRIRFQLMDMHTRQMLFDFTIPADAYNSLKSHIIEHLNNFTPKKEEDQ